MPSRKKPKSSDLTRCSSSSWAGSSSGVTRLRTSSASSGGPEAGVRLPVTRNMAGGGGAGAAGGALGGGAPGGHGGRAGHQQDIGRVARGRQVKQLVERRRGLRSARGGAFLAGRGAIQLSYDFGKFFRVVLAHWMSAVDVNR